jgi:TPR repeat protein
MKISSALLTVCLAVATFAMSIPAHAARRVALLIGNSNYQHEKPLPNPVRDIALVEAALLKLGFTVDKLENQDKRGMELNINRFVTKTAGADTALVFYAGHGTQSSKGGRSYLLPVNAKVEDDETLETDGVLAEDIANKLEQISNPAKLRLVILDACRSRKTTRGNDRGLAPPRPTDDYTLIAYSTKDGATADDGNGIHSPYAQALAKHLPRLAGEPVRVVLDDMGDDVKTATKQGQKPQSYGNLTYRIGLDGVQVVSVSVNPLDATQVAFAELARKLESGDMNALAELERNSIFQALRTRLKLDGANRLTANNGESANRQSAALTIVQAQSQDPEERALGEAMAVYLRIFPQTHELQTLVNAGNSFAALMLDFEYRIDGGDVPLEARSRLGELTQRAENSLKTMAANGNQIALIWLGNRYVVEKSGAEKNKAIALYEQAAAKGNIFAFYCIGRFYNRINDREKAFFWFTKGAEAGDPWAMGELASMYLVANKGRPRDTTKALDWYGRAAALDDVWAMGQLGVLYQQSDIGLPRPEAMRKSIEWLEKGTSAGDVNSMWALAQTYGNGFGGIPKDETRALDLYERAAQASPKCQQCFELAEFFSYGGGGLKKDGEMALKWYQEVAKRGGADGLRALGEVFWQGRGEIKEDRNKAVQFYRQAATAGSYRAMFYLGNLYGAGQEPFTKDRAKALEWYLKGVDAGGAKAMYELGERYSRNDYGLDKDEPKALEWYKKSAEAGNVDAMHRIAQMYEYGHGGLPKDNVQAEAWYLKSGGRRALTR